MLEQLRAQSDLSRDTKDTGTQGTHGAAPLWVSPPAQEAHKHWWEDPNHRNNPLA